MVLRAWGEMDGVARCWGGSRGGGKVAPRLLENEGGCRDSRAQATARQGPAPGTGTAGFVHPDADAAN